MTDKLLLQNKQYYIIVVISDLIKKEPSIFGDVVKNVLVKGI